MPKLGVNIDHIATLRQLRLSKEPDPLVAAGIVEKAGADGITIHLREDRRHIQDKDVYALRKTVKTKLNLEMALSKEIIRIALSVKPDSVCIVPEKRQELTTEGGLDIIKFSATLKKTIPLFRDKNIIVSLFIAPNLTQIKMAKSVGADAVELHTGEYANASGRQKTKELNKLKKAGAFARKLGLHLNAGHGLDYQNVGPVARLPGMEDLNIGYAIICRAVFVGLEEAVREMKEAIK